MTTTTEPQTALSQQIATYEDMRDTLETDHLGEWVVIHGQILVNTYDTFQNAAQDAIRRFGRGPYLIRQVGAPPARLPSSVLYRPAHADH